MYLEILLYQTFSQHSIHLLLHYLHIMYSLQLSTYLLGKTENMKLVHAINNALDIAMETDSTAGQTLPTNYSM